MIATVTLWCHLAPSVQKKISLVEHTLDHKWHYVAWFLVTLFYFNVVLMPLTEAHFQFNCDTEILIGSLEMLCWYFKILLCTTLLTVSSSAIKNSVFFFTGLQLDRVYLLPVTELNLTCTPRPRLPQLHLMLVSGFAAHCSLRVWVNEVPMLCFYPTDVVCQVT